MAEFSSSALALANAANEAHPETAEAMTALSVALAIVAVDAGVSLDRVKLEVATGYREMSGREGGHSEED